MILVMRSGCMVNMMINDVDDMFQFSTRLSILEEEVEVVRNMFSWHSRYFYNVGWSIRLRNQKGEILKMKTLIMYVFTFLSRKEEVKNCLHKVLSISIFHYFELFTDWRIDRIIHNAFFRNSIITIIHKSKFWYQLGKNSLT